MKKLMTAFAVCMMAGLVSAQVESQNIVGYSTSALKGATFNMFSVQFGTVGGGGFNINSGALSGDLLGAESNTDADQVQIWDPLTSSYAVYYLYSDGFWYNFNTDAAFQADYPTGLPAGTAFWYMAKGADGSATFAGEVPSTATVTKAITGGTFNMITFPYPVNAKLNDTAQCNWVACGANKAESNTDADQVQIWDAATSSYGVYYLYSDGLWYNFNTDAAFDADYTAGLPVGTAMWYLAKGTDFTLTFNKPY